MQLKSGVRIAGIRPEMVLAILIIERVFADHAVPLVLTSLMEGRHRRASLHYLGCAVDFRRHQADEKYKTEAVDRDLRAALGGDFDVVLEPTHWHVEFQPKTPINLTERS
ncbi:MAG: hypothetical protein AAGF15_02165 [Pseudomonadota bacterium]